MKKRISRRDFLKLTSLGFGAASLAACERFIQLSPTPVYSLPIAETTKSAPETIAKDEKWWLKPQTYHIGEGSDEPGIVQMKITVLHDWTFWGQEYYGEYVSYENIRQRWEGIHQRGMRIEAVVSIVDIFFVEIGADDEIYPYSGISLEGKHIQYDDPPAFVGCTNQPGWQAYLVRKMKDAVDMGVDGITIDDYEGTSRWVSGTPSGMAGLEAGPGGCFCPACEEGFREYLRITYSEAGLQAFDIPDINTFRYSEYLLERDWTSKRLGEESLKYSGWDSEAEITAPLYEDYAHFQNQRILEVTRYLRDSIKAYARDGYGKEIAWSANMGEYTYATHKFFPLYDRSVGSIWYFGIPPRGTEGYYYRLDYAIYGAPRIREVSRDPVVVAAINEYHADNLLAIKNAEAYANRGAYIEQGYYLVESAYDEEAEASAFHTDVETKYKNNSFYLEHKALFDFEATTSMARAAVLYASSSIKNNLYNHTIAFNGICEILTDLHVQYDTIFVGDGISNEDTLSGDVLSHYELVFLPNTASLTDSQVEAILAYVNAGGTVAALGEVGIMNEEGIEVKRPELSALTRQRYSEYGNGQFYHLRVDVFQADSVFDEEIHDIASAYFQYYIENSDPGIASLLYLYDEEPINHLSEETARAIRQEISALIDNSISARIVQDTLSENICVQAYLKSESPQEIFVHLINYDYELQTDNVHDQSDIPVAIKLPDTFEVESINVMSPDFDGTHELDFTIEDRYAKFTVPLLHIWDVIVIE